MSVVEADAGLTLTLAVDELDIRSVQPGQRVALSVDALSDAALTGVVQKVAPLGDTSSGVTTYDVTVTVSGEDERVKRRHERLRRDHRERRRRRDFDSDGRAAKGRRGVLRDAGKRGKRAA